VGGRAAEDGGFVNCGKNKDCQSCINQGCTFCVTSTPGTCQSMLLPCKHPETILSGCNTVDAAREALLGEGETWQRATRSTLCPGIDTSDMGSSKDTDG
jgi:hypothetical protein